MRNHVLVLGGGYAGTLAALRLSRVARVTLVDARPAFTQRIRHHELLAGRSPSGFTYRELLGRRGIDFVHGRVVGLEVAAGAAEVALEAGGGRRIGYDGAVLALGSRTRAVPGLEAHAVTLDHPDVLRRASGLIAALPAGARVLVVGGGMTGIESATAIAERHPGLRVALLAAEAPGHPLSPRGAAHLERAFGRLGIEVLRGAVTAVEAGHGQLTDGGDLAFDLCVWAGGFEAPPLAREAGLPTAPDGRVSVDGTLTVPGRPELVAAGDAAAVAFPGGTLRMGCVTALPMGAHAAATLALRLGGSEATPFRFTFPGRNIALGRRDALTQLTSGDDRPVDRVITGRAAAAVKEAIGRMTIGVLRAEAALGRPVYRWPGAAEARPSPQTLSVLPA